MKEFECQSTSEPRQTLIEVCDGGSSCMSDRLSQVLART